MFAALSERYIEQPFRFGVLSRFPVRQVLAAAGRAAWRWRPDRRKCSEPGSSGVSVRGPAHPPPASTSAPPLPQPVLAGPIPIDLQPPLSAARADGPGVGADKCRTEYTDTEVADCVYGNPTAPTTVVLYGDSHAAMWLPAIRALADERDWRIVVALKPSCTFVDVTVWSTELRRAFTDVINGEPCTGEDHVRKPCDHVVAGTLNYQLADPTDQVLHDLPSGRTQWRHRWHVSGHLRTGWSCLPRRLITQ